MQDGNDLEPQPASKFLKDNRSSIIEYSHNEQLDIDVADHQYNLEQLDQEYTNDTENMYPLSYDHVIDANVDQVVHNKSDILGQIDLLEEHFFLENEDDEQEEENDQEEQEECFIEETENYSTPVEVIQGKKTSINQHNEPVKPYNSLLLVQEFHTGLTSGDESGETEEDEVVGDEDEEDEAEEEEDVEDAEDEENAEDGEDAEEEEYEDPDEQFTNTTLEAIEPEQCLHTPSPPSPPSRPMDLDYIALKSFKSSATYEENAEREKNLQKYGLLFTREEYKYYSPKHNPPEDENYYEKVQRILASVAEKEKIWLAGERNKRKQDQEPESAAKKKRPESPIAPDISDASDTLDSYKAEPIDTMDSYNVEPIDSEPSPIAEIVSCLNLIKQDSSPVQPANLLRNSQSTREIGEPSDLEVAAMSADFDWNPNDTSHAMTKSGPQSGLSKNEHLEYLLFSEMLKKGEELTLENMTRFKTLSALVKAESEQFVKYQRKSVIESGVYDTLDPKVEKLVEEFYELEKERVHAYPQFYRYFNVMEMLPNATSEAPILAFKKCLFRQGQIAPCNPKMYDTSRTMNLFRKYLVNDSKLPDDEEEHIQYYKKKLLPAIIVDPVIPSLIKDTRPDVVISSECLTALVEIIHSITSDICIPISVVSTGADGKVLMLDRPFFRDALTARAKNKMVYDLAFKSLCLDWKKKHPISANQSKPTSPNSHGIAKEDLDMESDENIQYNLWSFGEMNVIIRHQADGELVGVVGSKERRVCLTTKLDYQIQPDGFEEILTPSERASQWIQSYVGGHAYILEGRIDVLKNRLVRVDQKQMKDIMSDNWKPSYESEMLRHTFLRLQKMLVPGHYLLQHKAGDRNFLIYQDTDKLENASPGVDLYSTYDSSTIPTSSYPESTHVPAWNKKKPLVDQIPWTFPALSP